MFGLGAVWSAFKLLGIWKRAGAVLPAIGKWVIGSPVHLLLVLLVLSLGWGFWERHDAQRWHERAQQCESASVAAKRAQDALRAKEQQAYQEKASHADQEYRASLDDARDLTRVYMQSHRVRKDDQRAAQPIGEAGPASVPESLPAGEPVVVDSADVQRAADWQSYGLACREWALSVSQ